jgi:hypothetical protein
MEILGHSDIRLTLNTYLHVMPSLQQDAADRMDALLRSESSRTRRPSIDPQSDPLTH